MIDITKLYYGISTPADTLRYGLTVPQQENTETIKTNSKQRKPIVVWCITRKCNLKCIHCYSNSDSIDYVNELSTEEGKILVDQLARYEIPVLLFSGGEPLLRSDIFELTKYAIQKGIRTVLSTNGTLITKEIAKKIKQSGISYVGISIDGIGKENDAFRGGDGAFDAAITGIRNCVETGQKVGVRFTITRYNYHCIPEIFQLIEREKVSRICFYHLVYSGRGADLQIADISLLEKRAVIDSIIQYTGELLKKRFVDVLTVDNHCDGIYLYLKLLKENPERAKEVFSLLKWNGGNLSGSQIAFVDNEGNVHPDQFLWEYNLGNIRERSFSEIWEDTSNETLYNLRNRKRVIKGRCSQCTYFALCNGNFRARALAVFGDIWREDPSCYLTDEEIFK